MTSNTLSILFDVFIDVGAHAVVVGAFVLWGHWQLRRYTGHRNDK